MSRALFAIGLLGCCCAPACVRADDFSWDLAANVSQGAVGNLQDSDGTALSASYYFAPVDDSRGPYGLAAFLDPVSRISASVGREKLTFHPILFIPPPGVVLSDTTVTHDDYTVGGRYVLPASKWYAGGDYTKTNFDTFDYGVDTFRVLAGKYLGQRTSLELAMDRSRLEFSDIDTKSVTEDVGLSFVHVRSHDSFTYSLFGGVTQTSGHLTLAGPGGTRFDSSLPRYWTYSFGAEAFPTTKVGIRVGYARFDGAGRDDSYDVAATWFFKRKMGLQLGWSRVEADGQRPHDDTASIRFVARL